MVWNALRNGFGWNSWPEFDPFVDGWSFVPVREDPPIEIWRREEGLRLRAQVPGLEANSLDLSVVGDVLTLKGTRNAPEARSFARTIRLPFSVDGETAKAKYDDGILEVELPRSPSERPRKIAVKST